MAEDSAITIELNDSDLSDSASSIVMIDRESSSSSEPSPKAAGKDSTVATPSSASKRKRNELEDEFNKAGGDPDLDSFIEMERLSPEPRRKFPTPQKPSKELDSPNIPDSVQEIPNFDDSLPETVNLLRTPYGDKVYLVGTAHFSQASQDDVAMVIQAVRPRCVVVELCMGRSDILLQDEETLLAAAKDMNLRKMLDIMKKNGTIQGLVYITLLSISAHVTKELGMAPGGEFRKAFAEASRVPRCQILMGDRPINVTMARLLHSLSWWQLIKLVWNLSNKESIKKEDVENAKKKDFLEVMLAEMAGEFPSLKQVLVTERDKFLAYSLQNAVAATQIDRLTSGNSSNVVVGVVGIGHAAGIKEHFGKVTDNDILEIMTIPPRSLTSRVLRTGFRLALYGGAAYAIYKFVPVQRVVDLVRPTGKLF